MKNKLTVPEKITLTAASLLLVYYLPFLVLCFFKIEALKMAVYILPIISVIFLPIIFHSYLKRALKHAYKPTLAVFCTLLCIYTASISAFWMFIGASPKEPPEYYTTEYALRGDTGADTVVLVFGCSTKNGEASHTLKNRLDAAYELLASLPDAICVVSGAIGSGETVAESEIMREYLISRGISEDRILEESNARTTSENIRFSKELLEELGMSERRVIGVSTDFHLPRIMILAKRYGLTLDACSAPSPSIFNYYINMMREYLSYIKMALFDKAVFSGGTRG